MPPGALGQQTLPSSPEDSEPRSCQRAPLFQRYVRKEPRLGKVPPGQRVGSGSGKGFTAGRIPQ